MDKDTISEVMREMGRRGGQKGGANRWKNMTEKERAEFMKKLSEKGNEARWRKVEAVVASATPVKKKAVKKAAAKKTTTKADGKKSATKKKNVKDKIERDRER